MNPTDNYRIPILRDMEVIYGFMFKKLSNEEKIFLIFSLSQGLEDECPYKHRNEIYHLANRFLDELIPETTDAIAVLKELVNSL